MTLKKLLLAFGLLSLGACANAPLVTMHQLDMVHGRVNPMRITKYNEKTCRLEVVEEQSYPVVFSVNSILHGAVCFAADDAALIKTDLQTKCKNARHERSSIESEK